MIGLGRRPLLLMVLGWVAVVSAVGAITFVVVSNAGSGVGRASAAERVVVVTNGASGSTSATPTGTPTSSATPSYPATTAPPSTPAPRTSPSTGTPRPTAKPAGPKPSAAAANTASFSTEGGTVVATCRGSRMYLSSIRPRDGWRFEPEYSRVALEVAFTSGEREVEMYLTCVNGVPTRAKSPGNGGAADRSSRESESPWMVRPSERVQSEGLEVDETPTSTPTEETPHG